MVECSSESFMHKDFRSYRTLPAFIYRLCHKDFSSIAGATGFIPKIQEKSSWTSMQINADKLTSEILV